MRPAGSPEEVLGVFLPVLGMKKRRQDTPKMACEKNEIGQNRLKTVKEKHEIHEIHESPVCIESISPGRRPTNDLQKK